MARINRRLVTMTAILLIALAAVTIVSAAAPPQLPNPLLLDNESPFGVPDGWIVQGDVTVVNQTGGIVPAPNDKAVVFPQTEKTSALYQNLLLDPPVDGYDGCLLAELKTKQLSANTGYFGVIVGFEGNIKAQIYKQIPAGSASYLNELPISIPSTATDVRVGAVYFGKKGSGGFWMGYMNTADFCL